MSEIQKALIFGFISGWFTGIIGLHLSNFIVSKLHKAVDRDSKMENDPDNDTVTSGPM